MKESMEKAFAWVDEHRDEALSMLKDFINTRSYSKAPESVVAMGKKLMSVLEAEGFECELKDVGEGYGPMLVGILGKERPGKPILFSGHMDTVLSLESYPENPFRLEEDGKMYGPGVLDMKGGIVIAINTVRALKSIGWAERPIKFVVAGDEEFFHFKSNTPEMFLEASKGCQCCFNLETSPIDNSLCIFRKGNLTVKITVEGVEAHSGNDFYSGISAIQEMAHKIIALSDLTDPESGTTVNCGIIKGGTVSNAIPRFCEMVVDTRICNMAALEKAKKDISKIANHSYISGTKCSMSIESSMNVFEETEAGVEWFNFINKVSQETGLGAIEPVRLGGSSDAAITTMAGVPTVCSAGIRGQWNHTTREYALAESLFERTKLYVAVLARISEYDG